MKYYAVKVGKKPGIYTSWDEAQPLVNGYPGAVYKSFKHKIDAEEFMKTGYQTKKPEEAENSAKSAEPQIEIDSGAVVLYTDGACSGNPGPGGWGAILIRNGKKTELSGGDAHTTNNRMELMAVISGLEMLSESCTVELYSDSAYVVNGLTKGWAKKWREGGWYKSDGHPAINPDLWERLLDLYEYHDVHPHWVKGHAENKYNERCDRLAVTESRKFLDKKRN